MWLVHRLWLLGAGDEKSHSGDGVMWPYQPTVEAVVPKTEKERKWQYLQPT